MKKQKRDMNERAFARGYRAGVERRSKDLQNGQATRLCHQKLLILIRRIERVFNAPRDSFINDVFTIIAVQADYD